MPQSLSNSIDVSIVVEGYNETLEIGSVNETMEALRRQTHPLDRVEVVLVGSEEQTRAWAAFADSPAPFARVRTLDAGSNHYYALKNIGARSAAAPVVVFIDSDVMPEPQWLGALMGAMRSGAVATCGPSLFRCGPLESSRELPLMVAAAISWSFILGPKGIARGFLSHNLGFQSEAFGRIGYRTDYGRTLAGSVLFEDMRKQGIQPLFVHQQRVAHAFTWRWWFSRLHVRFGHEVYLLHRLNVPAVSRHAKWLGPIDAVATPVWHVVLDFPNWWRYSAALEVPLWKRVAGMAWVLPLSLLARGGEMAGMLGTVFAENRMREFAARN